MLSQIAAAFRLQQGYQVTDLDEELITRPSNSVAVLFVRITALYPIPETLANRAGEIIVKSNSGTRKGQAGAGSCGKR
jgi:hypothetical protein